MRISEVADRVGLSAKTIRFYESEGLIPPPQRLSNGYRSYGPEDERRLLTVAAARAVGLPLDDIGELLDLDANGEQPCERLAQMARQQRDRVRTMIDTLHQTEARLSDIIEQADDSDAAVIVSDAACPVLMAPH